jgi:hypothetical protein
MLQSIRDRTHGWIATVIISLLILSFALWGIHSYMIGGSYQVDAAKVNGIGIRKTEVNAAYERLHRQLLQSQNSGNDLSASVQASLKVEALQQLINLQALSQASLSQGYRVSENQVDGFLQGMSQFKVNGKFSVDKFEQMLAGALYTPNEFMRFIKTTLLIEQPRLGVIFSSFALPDEIANTISLVNQKRDFEYFILPPQYTLVDPLRVPSDKIEAYYHKHQEEFKAPEQVSLDYIQLSLSDVMGKLHPSDKELKQFYSENISSFSQYKRGKTKNAAVLSFAKVKDKVRQAWLSQKAEEQFANLREKLANMTYEQPDSLKSTAQELGLPIRSTGLFTQETGGKDISSMTKVRDTAFSHDVLSLRNNSDVIQIGRDSVVVVRVKLHLPVRPMPLTMVQGQIARKLQESEINNKTEQVAKHIVQELQSGSDLKKINFRSRPAKWIATGFIGRHSSKVDPAILDMAFAIPKSAGDHSYSYGIVKVANGYAVVRLKSVRDGEVNGQNEYRIFAEQIQNTQGLLEYELYKESLFKEAKVTLQS